jgi:hypothetical protein
VSSRFLSRVKQLTRNRARLALPQVKTDFAGRREGAPLRLTLCRSRLERLRTLAADASAKVVHRAACAKSRVARWTRARERKQRASRPVPGYVQWTLILRADLECTSARLSALARLRTAHPCTLASHPPPSRLASPAAGRRWGTRRTGMTPGVSSCRDQTRTWRTRGPGARAQTNCVEVARE